jgi:hypothetical protein
MTLPVSLIKPVKLAMLLLPIALGACSSSATLTATPNITPLPSSTPPAAPSPTPELFPTEIYPDPVPRSGEGAVFFDLCPNPAGIEDFAGFPIETAIDLVNLLHSGDRQEQMKATDAALWPTLDTYADGSQQIDGYWFDGKVERAVNSPYAATLAGQCGQQTIDQSWTARVCPGPCSQSTSESLKEDYFFLWRGYALIWMVWP